MVTLPKFRPKLGIRDKYQNVPVKSTMMFIEKAEPLVETFGGTTTMDNITDALDEFGRLFKAGVASDAEILTLARAFPENPAYTTAAINIPDEAVMVVGGPASIELIDREGHLITTGALRNAFVKYMDNFRTRNAMVLHSDVQVGWALPAYITKGGVIYKSQVGDKGLFFLCEIRNDTKIAERVRDQIKQGKLKSYSIAGSATKVQNMTKGLMPYMQVDEMELAEVTVCEKGVNQGASFELLKAEQTEQTGKVSKDQCDYREATPAELATNISCGSCAYFNKQDASCDTVVGIIEADDYCTLYKPEEVASDTMETEETEGVKIEIHLSQKTDGSIDFTRSFLNLIRKEFNPFGDVKAAKFLGEHPPGQAHITDPTTGKTMTFNEGGGTGSWADSQVGKYQTWMQQNDPKSVPHTDWEGFRGAIDRGDVAEFGSEDYYGRGGANLTGLEELEDMKDADVDEQAELMRVIREGDPENDPNLTDAEYEKKFWQGYNKVEAFQKFWKQEEEDPTIGGRDSDWSLPITITPSSAKLDFTPTEKIPLGGGGGKMENDAVAKMEKYISNAQHQWTINEEPPSFNWGPYGLQSKSNIGV